MADISVRGLDDRVRDRIRTRAAQHGRSMEAEVREILTEAVDTLEPPTDLMAELRRAALAVGGVELDIPPRTDVPRVPDLPW